MNPSMSPVEIAKVIAQLKRVVIVAHYNPDSDAYGSSCGLALSLIKAGHEVACVNESGINQRYLFIPGVSAVQQTIPPGNWDGLVVCDCGELNRVGDSIIPFLKRFPVVVNIDHHATNQFFGDHNLVREDASSTSELVFEIVRAGSLPIDADVATCLFSGLSGDTGSFRFSSTTERALRVAAELVACGANPTKVANAIYSSNSLGAVKLEALALAELELYFERRLGIVVVTSEMYRQAQAVSDDSDPLVDKIRDIRGVNVAVLIREFGDLWRVSMRSKDPVWDVSKVAARFGGGGHKSAAAFRWRRDLSLLKESLIEEIRRLF